MAELTAHNDARSETVLQEFRAPRMVDKAMTYDDVFKFSLDPSPASAIRLRSHLQPNNRRSRR